VPEVLRRFVDPEVDRHLLDDEGEFIIDEVAKHWITLVLPVTAMAASMVFFIAMIVVPSVWALLMVIGLVLDAWAAIRIHQMHMDRFVITNMRVFRVHGIINQHLATMPMTRILDISVEQPLMGRLCGYGHFIFESAAQDQGLRVIRYVGDPEKRDLTIQRVIQMAGLRTNLAHPR
jgi:membrane protein YdbS with pleckstrin-like domain